MIENKMMMKKRIKVHKVNSKACLNVSFFAKDELEFYISVTTRIKIVMVFFRIPTLLVNLNCIGKTCTKKLLDLM